MRVYKEFNDVIDKEISLLLVEKEAGLWGVSYACMEDLLFNHMPENLEVNYRIDIITATADYAAVKCEITDIRGRHTFGVGDVSVKSTKFKGENQKAFSSEHPLTPAIQSAISIAVQKYLKLPKSFAFNDEETYSENNAEIEQDFLSGFVDVDGYGYGETEIFRDDEIEMDEAFSESVEDLMEQAESEPDDIFTDEEEKDNEAEVKQETTSCAYDDAVFPNGRFGGRTCKDVWENEGEAGREAIRQALNYSTAGRWKDVVMFAREHVKEI